MTGIMLEWLKPNGTKITTNDSKASIAAAVKLGWELVKDDDDVTVEDVKKMPKKKLLELIEEYDLDIDTASIDKVADLRDAVIAQMEE